MTSLASPTAKPPIFSAPTRLTPSEIESLRAHKREVSIRGRAALAKIAAEQAARQEPAAAE